MTRYMLDTNIVSSLMRDPAGIVAHHIARVGDQGLCVSVVTAAELRFGAMKRGSTQLISRVDAVLARISVLPFEPPADAAYASIRAALERSGRPIGPNDLLIAAHGRVIGATVVTANVGEFGRVPGLTVEDWTVWDAG